MAKAINLTKEISVNCTFCRSNLRKSIGLMFSKRKDDFCMIFLFTSPRRLSIHMMFVFYPIDLVFLDEHKKVVEIKEGLRPFCFYTSRCMAQYFLELPEGTIKRKSIKAGQRIDWE